MKYAEYFVKVAYFYRKHYITHFCTHFCEHVEVSICWKGLCVWYVEVSIKHVCSNYSQMWFMALPSHSEKCYPSSTLMQSSQPCPSKHSNFFPLPIFFLTFSLNFNVFSHQYSSISYNCKSYIIYNHKVIWFLSFVLTNLFAFYGRCTVCLGDYQLNEKLLQLPTCGHSFHVECIDEWLSKNITCPICRTSLLLDEDGNTSECSVVVNDAARRRDDDNLETSDSRRMWEERVLNQIQEQFSFPRINESSGLGPNSSSQPSGNGYSERGAEVSISLERSWWPIRRIIIVQTINVCHTKFLQALNVWCGFESLSSPTWIVHVVYIVMIERNFGICRNHNLDCWWQCYVVHFHNVKMISLAKRKALCCAHIEMQHEK